MARRRPSRGAWLRRSGPEADAEREKLARRLAQHELAALGSYYWEGWARDEQLPPREAWRTGLICAGRGFGKTRAGAEWVRDVARNDGNARIALVGASLTEVRNVMVEGDSGVLAAAPGALDPVFESSLRKLTWENGAIAWLYSAGEPEALRGPQHSHACPEGWRQRAAGGTPARTGWEPPSALLSSASGPAMAWLRAVATKFAGLIAQSGASVHFQVGEPWWWILPDGRPCLYDDAARAAFGGSPPVIADMRGLLGQPQLDLLDAAGALLAEATRGIAEAVRAAAAPEPAEVLLLVFTPTVLDPAMPEARRANLPGGWAWPAFDRLQVEDYDWLTAGAEALRRAAYVTVNDCLGYPLERQDYLAGFVLDPADAETLSPRIDAGLDEAIGLGVARTFVWASPQVSRDGYTRLVPLQEDTFQPSDDVPYPLALGREARVSFEFSTSVAVTASGHERRNSLRSDARSGSWVFATPIDGMRVFDRSTGQSIPYIGECQREETPPAPNGRTAVDLEARTAVVAVIQHLRRTGALPAT